MLGSQKETELKGGKKSAFRVIWNREGRETLSEDHVHQRQTAEKKADICESLMCLRSEGQDEDCLCSTRRCWERKGAVSRRNICSPKILEK